MLTVSGKTIRGTIDVPPKSTVAPPAAVPNVVPQAAPRVIVNPLEVKAGYASRGQPLEPLGVSPIMNRAILAGVVIPKEPKVAAPKAPLPKTPQNTAPKAPNPPNRKPSKALGYAIAGVSVLGAMAIAAFGAQSMKGGSNNGRGQPNPSSGVRTATNPVPYTEFTGGNGTGSIAGAIY